MKLKNLFWAAALGLAIAAPAKAQDYPARTVQIVVPFAAGGASDVVARLAAEGLARELGQQFVVDNKPGAAGNIGARQVASAAPDGYTLMHTSSAVLINPALYKDPGYQIGQFQPVLMSGSNCSAVVANPAYGVKTFDELIEKAGKETLHYGTAGIGSTPFITGEMLFNQLAKVGAKHVPYTGGGPALAAVLGNETPVAILTVATGNLVEMVATGRLQALAVTCSERHPSLPDVPTLLETRFADYGTDATWGGFFVPAGTPAAVVEKLNSTLVRIFSADPVKSRIAAMGLSWSPHSAADFTAQVSKEAADWAERVRRIGIPQQ